MKIKLFTHTDLDGVGCAIVMKHAFEDADYDLCGNHEIDQKVAQFIADKEYVKYDQVFITDISVNKNNAEMINQIHTEGKTTWKLLDHHATALWLNEYEWATVKVEHFPDVKASGTSLLDMHLIDNGQASDKDWNMGQFTEKVRRYDTWEWQTKYSDDHAKQLNDLLYIVGQNQFIKRFIDNCDPTFTESEQLLLEIEQKRIDAYVDQKRKQLQKIRIENYMVGVVFAETNHSIVGNVLAKENPDVEFIAMLNPASGGISYRAVKDTIDVGAFAKKYGGGGHAKASGSSLSGDLVVSWMYEAFDENFLVQED